MSSETSPLVERIEYDDDSCTYRLTFDCESQLPSRELLRAVALIEGRDSLDLPPLYEQVDPPALDSVVCRGRIPSRSSTEVSFRYCGYEVRVGADETIEIDHGVESATDRAHHDVDFWDSDR